MQLDEILRIYLARNLRIEKESTRKLYRGVVAAYSEFLGRSADAQDLTDDRLAEPGEF